MFLSPLPSTQAFVPSNPTPPSPPPGVLTLSPPRCRTRPPPQAEFPSPGVHTLSGPSLAPPPLPGCMYLVPHPLGRSFPGVGHCLLCGLSSLPSSGVRTLFPAPSVGPSPLSDTASYSGWVSSPSRVYVLCPPAPWSAPPQYRTQPPPWAEFPALLRGMYLVLRPLGQPLPGVGHCLLLGLGVLPSLGVHTLSTGCSAVGPSPVSDTTSSPPLGVCTLSPGPLAVGPSPGVRHRLLPSPGCMYLVPRPLGCQPLPGVGHHLLPSPGCTYLVPRPLGCWPLPGVRHCLLPSPGCMYLVHRPLSCWPLTGVRHHLLPSPGCTYLVPQPSPVSDTASSSSRCLPSLGVRTLSAGPSVGPSPVLEMGSSWARYPPLPGCTYLVPRPLGCRSLPGVGHCLLLGLGVSLPRVYVPCPPVHRRSAPPRCRTPPPPRAGSPGGPVAPAVRVALWTSTAPPLPSDRRPSPSTLSSVNVKTCNIFVFIIYGQQFLTRDQRSTPILD